MLKKTLILTFTIIILSSTFSLGFGDLFDPAKMEAEIKKLIEENKKLNKDLLDKSNFVGERYGKGMEWVYDFEYKGKKINATIKQIPFSKTCEFKISIGDSVYEGNMTMAFLLNPNKNFDITISSGKKEIRGKIEMYETNPPSDMQELKRKIKDLISLTEGNTPISGTIEYKRAPEVKTIINIEYSNKILNGEMSYEGPESLEDAFKSFKEGFSGKTTNIGIYKYNFNNKILKGQIHAGAGFLVYYLNANNIEDDDILIFLFIEIYREIDGILDPPEDRTKDRTGGRGSEREHGGGRGGW